jgi:hypothetical protein
MFRLVLLGTCLASVSAGLLAVQTISRHGARAPDDDFFANLCPADTNKWSVANEMLTGKGMMQLHNLGTIVKELYTNSTGVVDTVFHSSQLEMQSDKTMRCQQSALSFGAGMFPAACAPEGYMFSAPVPYSFLKKDDNLLACKKYGCKKWWKKQDASWKTDVGMDYVQKPVHKTLLDAVGKACGSDLFHISSEIDVFDALKDINVSCCQAHTRSSTRALNTLVISSGSPPTLLRTDS